MTSRNPGQASGAQIAEERQPAGAVLGRGHLQAADLPVAVAVDAGRNQGVDSDHATALADLQHQGVGCDEGVGPVSNGRVRNASTCASRSRAIAETCDFEGLVMPSDSTGFSICHVDTPSR